MNRPSYLLFKQCSKCGEILHVSRFHKSKSGKYGVRKICKECRKEISKIEYKDNKEYIKKRSKEYKEIHKDELLKKNKQYYLEHKEERIEYQKQYYKDNKKYVNDYHKKHYKENTEKYFNSRNKRRQKLENQGRGITKEQWYEMMMFFDWTCAYSGEYIGSNSDKRTIDHIVALDNGGEHEIWNCIPCYANYNYSKHTNNMLEWYLEQDYFDINRLTKIYEWRIYAYWKWNEKESV